MISILDRLLLKRFFGAYASFGTIVIVIYVFADLFTHIERFTAVRGRSFVEAAILYYTAVLPETYYLFAPFLALVSAMWVIASLQRANELIPLMAAGVRPLRVIMPIALATAVLACAMWADREMLIPRLAKLRRQWSKFNWKETRTPSPVPDDRGGIMSARTYRTNEQRLIEARYTRFDEKSREVFTLLAGTADPVPGGWQLRDGVKIEAADGKPDRFVPIDEKAGVFLATDLRPVDIESAIEDLDYLAAGQLRAQIARLPGLRSLEVQLAKRVAYPTASLVLLALGIPFVLRAERGAAPLGLLLCLALCALFFVATSFFEHLGSRPGGPAPDLAAWAANALFGAAAAVALARARV